MAAVHRLSVCLSVSTHNNIAALHEDTASLHTDGAVSMSLHLFSYCWYCTWTVTVFELTDFSVLPSIDYSQHQTKLTVEEAMTHTKLWVLSLQHFEIINGYYCFTLNCLWGRWYWNISDAVWADFRTNFLQRMTSCCLHCWPQNIPTARWQGPTLRSTMSWYLDLQRGRTTSSHLKAQHVKIQQRGSKLHTTTIWPGATKCTKTSFVCQGKRISYRIVMGNP